MPHYSYGLLTAHEQEYVELQVGGMVRHVLAADREAGIAQLVEDHFRAVWADERATFAAGVNDQDRTRELESELDDVEAAYRQWRSAIEFEAPFAEGRSFIVDKRERWLLMLEGGGTAWRAYRHISGYRAPQIVLKGPSGHLTIPPDPTLTRFDPEVDDEASLDWTRIVEEYLPLLYSESARLMGLRNELARRRVHAQAGTNLHPDGADEAFVAWRATRPQPDCTSTPFLAWVVSLRLPTDSEEETVDGRTVDCSRGWPEDAVLRYLSVAGADGWQVASVLEDKKIVEERNSPFRVRYLLQREG